MRAVLKAAAAVVLLISPHSSEAHSVQRNPLNYITSVDAPRIHTPGQRVHAHSSFDLSFLLHDGADQIRIALEPNHDVLSPDATIRHLGPDGAVTREEKVDRAQYRVFRGHTFVQHPHHAEWINSGWARILVHRDGPEPVFEGTFRVNGDHHHIQSARTYRQTRLDGDPEAPHAGDEYMVVWRDSDVMATPNDLTTELKRDLPGQGSVCSSDRLDFNNLYNHPVRLGLDVRGLSSVEMKDLIGRQAIDGTTGGNSAGVNLASSIGSTAGCPTTRKVALVGIATDCTYTAAFNSSSNARSNVISLVNSASAVYESTFNISLGIQNLTISDATCPGTPAQNTEWNQACSSDVTISDRLGLFSTWRGQFNDTNAYWTLLSTCNTEAAVGLAWLGQLCTQGSTPNGNDTTAGANVVVRTSTEWQVFAHETGHIFGAVHDCTDTTCSDGTSSMQQCCPLSASSCNADGAFIMNPSTGPGLTQFSACTVGNICSALDRGSVNAACLSDNKNIVTITNAQCGNGIVEAGEECDCGGTEACGDNPCCDPTTCKYKSNAVCDFSNEDCCTDACQYQSAGTVCRASTGSCDPQETCSGAAALCPADAKAPDEQSCGAGGSSGLKCASGQCTSRDLQCQTLVGNGTTACDASSCQVRCASPQLGPNACYDLQQYFLDGTPCEGGGHCANGQCKGASFTDEVAAWVRDNKEIVIPVAVVVGLLVLAALSSCAKGGSSGSRRHRAKPPNSSWVGGGPAVPLPVARGANGSGAPSRRSQRPSRHGPGGGGGGDGDASMWDAQPRRPLARYG
ncbi:zinc metalloprotease mde10 [Xylariaceae sp. FL0804]|nr:zinc metalloprotease mde10 [Xylariaceae sp. FL0804]